MQQNTIVLNREINQFHSFYDAVLKKGGKPKTNTIEKSLVKADRKLALLLDIDIEDIVYHLVELHYINGQLCEYEKIWIPYDFLKNNYNITKENIESFDCRRRLPIKKIKEKLLLQPVKDFLEIFPSESEMASIQGVSYDENGNILQYSETYFPPSLYTYYGEQYGQ